MVAGSTLILLSVSIFALCCRPNFILSLTLSLGHPSQNTWLWPRFLFEYGHRSLFSTLFKLSHSSSSAMKNTWKKYISSLCTAHIFICYQPRLSVKLFVIVLLLFPHNNKQNSSELVYSTSDMSRYEWYKCLNTFREEKNYKNYIILPFLRICIISYEEGGKSITGMSLVYYPLKSQLHKRPGSSRDVKKQKKYLMAGPLKPFPLPPTPPPLELNGRLNFFF